MGSAPGIDLPSSVRMDQSDISFSSAARNLGVIFDSELPLKEQVKKLCQLAYLETRRIGSIRQYLSVEATRTVVSYLVLSRLNYCNALLADHPRVLLDQIQRVISCSARLVYKAPKSAHITPLLFDLHWLPISSRIQYKIALSVSTLSLVQPLHTSLSCFTSVLLLFVFVQPQILKFSVSQGCAGGLLGRDPSCISDLSSGTLFISLSGMPCHSPLSSQN